MPVPIEDDVTDVAVGDPVPRGALDGVIAKHDSDRHTHREPSYGTCGGRSDHPPPPASPAPRQP